MDRSPEGRRREIGAEYDIRQAFGAVKRLNQAARAQPCQQVQSLLIASCRELLPAATMVQVLVGCFVMTDIGRCTDHRQVIGGGTSDSAPRGERLVTLRLKKT